MMKRVSSGVFIILSVVILLVSVSRLCAQNTLWTRTFGTAFSDRGYSVIESSEGGYVVAGYTSFFGTGINVSLIKIDEDGNTLWSKTYGGAEDEEGYSVIENSEGGYVIAGWTESFGAGEKDVYLIKTDENGNELWSKTYGGPDYERGYSVIECSTGGYMIAGYKEPFSSGKTDLWLIRTGENGDTLWTKTYGGTGNEEGYSVIESSERGYVIAGWTESFGAGGFDVYLIRIDENGNELWIRTYGGTGHEQGYSVIESSEGGYVIAGWTDSFGAGGFDVYLIKVDENGNELWTRTYGGTDSDYGYSVIECSTGGYAITGYTMSFGGGKQDLWLIRTDENGNELWTRIYGGPEDDLGYSLTESSEGGYVIAGWTQSFGEGHSDIWLIRVGDTLGIEENTTNYFNVSANPVGKEVVFYYSVEYGKPDMKLIVYDISGTPVYAHNLSSRKNKFLWYGTDQSGKRLSPGIYFYRVEGNNFIKRGKLVLLR